MTIREPEKEIEVLDKVDVVVAGAGVAGCTAAALAAKLGKTPRQLDIRELQKKLLADGVYLGHDERLKKLELLF